MKTGNPALGLGWWSRWGCAQSGIALLTSEQTVAVVGEGVKDAVGCHDTETQVVRSPSLSVRSSGRRAERDRS